MRKSSCTVICAGERWRYRVTRCIQDFTIKGSLNGGQGNVYRNIILKKVEAIQYLIPTFNRALSLI